ncbi:hypothetical protein Tco_0953028 [Tanacetum coccineum]|uniref:Uncharacterized protein n=1 Tax=Tanacetum coccineum TaxID=301880 RepID=A0ABQ5E0J5_9ASTR
MCGAVLVGGSQVSSIWVSVVLLLLLLVLVVAEMVVSAGFLETDQVNRSMEKTYAVAALIQLDMLQGMVNFVMLLSHPQISLQRKTGFGIVTSWREEDLIREIDLYMPTYQCRLLILRKMEHLRKTLLKCQHKVGEFIGFVV